jgi:hypothetical protein
MIIKKTYDTRVSFKWMVNALASVDELNLLFTAWVFFYLIVLIIHFSIRRVFFDSYTMRYGWWVYLLGIPAAVISIIMLRGGMTWSFTVGGLLCLAFSGFGYYVDYVLTTPWRSPVFLPILIPYVILYLGTIMFYWFPLALINRNLWYIYTMLFAISTILNITSH